MLKVKGKRLIGAEKEMPIVHVGEKGTHARCFSAVQTEDECLILSPATNDNVI